MIIELRKKAQITLPKEIVKQLNIQEGDKFDVSIENGCIKLQPVVVYPKEYIEKIEKEVQNLKESLGENSKEYSNVDELIKNLKDVQ